MSETRPAYAALPVRRGGNNSGNHNDLIASIRQYLLMRGAYYLKLGGGLGIRAGSPDVLSCLGGRMVAVEAKTGSAVLSTSQQREKAAIERAGGLYVLCRDLEGLEDALVGAGLCTPALLPLRRA